MEKITIISDRHYDNLRLGVKKYFKDINFEVSSLKLGKKSELTIKTRDNISFEELKGFVFLNYQYVIA